jgi:hypothetical protein
MLLTGKQETDESLFIIVERGDIQSHIYYRPVFFL